MKFLRLWPLAMLMMGCTTIRGTMDQWASLNNSKREFEVKTAWVRRATAEDNLGFRKINRMTPLIVGDLIIQGNGVDGLTAYSRESGRLQSVSYTHLTLPTKA